MKLSKVTLTASAIAIVAAGIALWPASAQPPAGDKPAGQPPAGPGAGQPGDRPGRGDRMGGPLGEWRQKFADEIRDHPSMGMALASMSATKDYMEKSKETFGGKKDATIKALDEAIKQVKEAIKFDPKREPPAGGDQPRRRGGGGGGGGGGGDNPGDSKPPAKP